ncbi:hypothetical protein ACIBJC_08285 [Streptomyces sp. NPDC050509]|uniref:hypothetical protein n=1 Tax=Streptomyces sp. NPDC050509 TaxID=3365620 RepID=UPI0037A7C433
MAESDDVESTLRLIDAAGRSGAVLVDAARTAVGVEGWVVLADAVAGVVYSAPDGAGPAGLRTAAIRRRPV